jgi:DNA replication protein DnaC
MSNTATLPLLLKQLGLPSMLSHWEEQSNIAQENNWTYPQYLAVLSNMEASSRQQKRVMRHIKESKLPPGKTLDSFNFKATPSLNAAQITALAENTSWVKQNKNLIIFGPSGVGKTHLAAAIAYRLIDYGVRALFMKTTALVQTLQQAQNEFKLAAVLARLARFPILILDDIGYVKKTDAETSVLFELIADRYETNSLIITSNHPFGEWDQIFPDNVMAVAAIDRLVHHATIINIEAQSYRTREQKSLDRTNKK